MKEGMKITLKKSNNKRCVSHYKNLPFDQNEEEEKDCPFTQSGEEKHTKQQNPDLQLAESFKDEGNKLAEDGRYKEALGKWEAAITLIPDKAVLHEQKAQVLLEIGDDWNALKAAARATELEPSWAEAWITLARTQLNFGEPDAAIESFDRALAIKPDSKEARDDRQTALHLVKRRKQLQLSGLSSSDSRFIVGDVSRACEGI
ncbi:hypothetical protein IFM89_018174 [Coptis chinensis]|uniref:Tetratricopeptide repeat protein 33 n=1 Tax=Coptis chinensis TaxID=261450 RepID=A0A835I379_9MAGN|nr:hypothetical protein IFM89_018174 [Coptis chinensis]